MNKAETSTFMYQIFIKMNVYVHVYSNNTTKAESVYIAQFWPLACQMSGDYAAACERTVR